MDNASVINAISNMSVWALLRFIMDNRECLTDPYYREFGAAIEARAKELCDG